MMGRNKGKAEGNRGRRGRGMGKVIVSYKERIQINCSRSGKDHCVK